jgi:hypothetical protein
MKKQYQKSSCLALTTGCATIAPRVRRRQVAAPSTEAMTYLQQAGFNFDNGLPAPPPTNAPPPPPQSPTWNGKYPWRADPGKVVSGFFLTVSLTGRRASYRPRYTIKGVAWGCNASTANCVVSRRCSSKQLTYPSS